MFLSLSFYLIFVLFSLGHLGRVSFYGQQINFYLYEVLVLLGLLHLLLKYGLKPIKESYKKYQIIYIFFLFLLISFFLGIMNFKLWENFIGFLYFLRLISYFAYFFYLVYHLKKAPLFGRNIRRGFLLFVSITTITSVLQYLFYPDLRNLIYAGWDPHLYRIFGTFFDTSIAGAIYGLIFITLFLNGKDFIKNKIILISSLITFLVFIVLTYSRTLYGVIIVMCILYTIVKRYYKRFIVFLVIFISLILLVPKPFGEGVNLLRTFSLEARIQDYKNALNIWQKYPNIGIGYNRIRFEKVKLNIIDLDGADISHSGASFHSSFLVILVSSGIIGLVLFILILVKLAQFDIYAKYVVGFLSLLSLSDNILLHPFILFLFLNLVLLSTLTPFHKMR